LSNANQEYFLFYYFNHFRRLYDPYADISTAMGGRRAAFQLPEGPEFVFQEEAAARRRGWTENLQFYTGVGYLGGKLTHQVFVASDADHQHGMPLEHQQQGQSAAAVTAYQ
jgi:hypothetical protein